MVAIGKWKTAFLTEYKNKISELETQKLQYRVAQRSSLVNIWE